MFTLGHLFLLTNKKKLVKSKFYFLASKWGGGGGGGGGNIALYHVSYRIFFSLEHNIGHKLSKPVFMVSDKEGFKPACSATGTS